MAQNAKVYLAQALIMLMEEHPLDEIKIKDIVKKAGVSRMTYYRYFGEKREILSFYMDHIFDNFLELENAGNAPKFRSIKHIEFVLEYFKNYSDFALCLYHAGLEGIMLGAVNKYMKLKQEDENIHDENKLFFFYAYSGAIYNCYMQWILSGFEASPKNIARIIFRL